MRIWYLNHYASTPDQPTTGAYFLMHALAERGHFITIFASGFNYYSRKELRLGRNLFTKREKSGLLSFQWIRTLPTNGQPATRFLNMVSFGLVSFLVGLTQRPKPDIVIASCPHPFAGISAWLLARYYGAKFIYEIRDIWPESLTEAGLLPSNSIARLMFAMQRMLYRNATLVTSVLPKIDAYLASIGLSHVPFLWLPNGISIDAAVLPEPSGGSKDAARPFHLMYIGGHSKYQNIDIILDAAHLLEQRGHTNLHITLIGDGSEKARLVSRAQALKLTTVTFKNAVPRGEVLAAAAEADGFIYHLRPMKLLAYGMSPNKLCDYMLAGRPIVFAAEAGNNPVAECDCGISIAPEMPAAMADAIMTLQEMFPETRRAMGERAQRYATEHFDSKEIAARFDAVLSA